MKKINNICIHKIIVSVLICSSYNTIEAVRSKSKPLTKTQQSKTIIKTPKSNTKETKKRRPKQTLITLASARTIEQRLKNGLGFNHFTDTSQIHTELGGRRASPSDVEQCLDSHLKAYESHLLYNSGAIAMMNRNTEQILAALLKPEDKE